MPRTFLALLIALCGILGVGCPLSRGVVNASPGLRFWLFSNFGASRMCPELLARGIPLELSELGPRTVGRFFPQQCEAKVDDARRVVLLTASGTGYAHLPVARRVGFAVTMGVEYAPDFRMESDALYVWGRTSRMLHPPRLSIAFTENPVVNLATQTPVGTVAAALASGLVASEIGKGFTVVRREDGDVFVLGHVEPGAPLPPRPFAPRGGHVVLESRATALPPASREYLGPFTIEDASVIRVTTRVAAGQASVAVVERSVGEAWRRSYETTPGMAPPAGQVLGQGTLAGATSLAFAVPRGTYYVVLENQAQAPALHVPMPFSEGALAIDYSVECAGR